MDQNEGHRFGGPFDMWSITDHEWWHLDWLNVHSVMVHFLHNNITYFFLPSHYRRWPPFDAVTTISDDEISFFPLKTKILNKHSHSSPFSSSSPLTMVVREKTKCFFSGGITTTKTQEEHKLLLPSWICRHYFVRCCKSVHIKQ